MRMLMLPCPLRLRPSGYEAVYIFLWLVSQPAFVRLIHASSSNGTSTESPASPSSTSTPSPSPSSTASASASGSVAPNGRSFSWTPTPTTPYSRALTAWGSDADAAPSQYSTLKRATFTYPRRASQYKRYAGGGVASGPMTTIYDDDNDYSDYHQTPSYHHHPSWHPSPPVVYVSDNHHAKEEKWDLTTKLIALAVLKIVLAKIIGFGIFKIILVLMFKLPFVVFAFAAKLAIFLKFIKFLKLITALLLLPLFLLILLPLLLPLLLLLLPLLLLPLLLLFPVPVLAPNAGAAVGGRRRREDDVDRIHSALLDAQLCFQRLACHVGEASRPTVGPYASWSLWLLDMVRPLFPAPKRDLLGAYSEAYRRGIEGEGGCSANFGCAFVDVDSAKSNSTTSSASANRRKGRRRRSHKATASQ